MNKGKISSEELRLQLAESLPGAIQIFARSIGKSEQELFKMMEQGQLLAEDVLPKVAKEMKKVAAVGLESKLQTLRVAQGQFLNELTKSQKVIFDSGFSEGLKDLLFQLVDFLQTKDHVLESMGQAFKFIFNVIRAISAVVTPIIGSLTFVMGKLSELMNNTVFSDSMVMRIGGIAAAVYGVVKATKLLNTALKAQLALRAKNLLMSKVGLAIMGGLLAEDAYLAVADGNSDTLLGAKGTATGDVINAGRSFFSEGGFSGYMDRYAQNEKARLEQITLKINTDEGTEVKILENNSRAKVEGYD